MCGNYLKQEKKMKHPYRSALNKKFTNDDGLYQLKNRIQLLFPKLPDLPELLT